MTADVYIGGEPYTVDDDTLVHVPCGRRLFGDDQRTNHVCTFECETCGHRTEVLVDCYGDKCCSWRCWIDTSGLCLCLDPMCPDSQTARNVRDILNSLREPA